jgi:hypothetical protein
MMRSMSIILSPGLEASASDPMIKFVCSISGSIHNCQYEILAVRSEHIFDYGCQALLLKGVSTIRYDLEMIGKAD